MRTSPIRSTPLSRQRAFVSLLVASAGLTLWVVSDISAGTFIRYHGLSCGTNAHNEAIACVRRDGRGYVAGMSANAVAIQDADKRVVYFRRNVGRSNPFPFRGLTLLRFDRLRCTARLPATISCAREDGVGLAIVISRTTVSVVRLSDRKRVFIRRNL